MTPFDWLYNFFVSQKEPEDPNVISDIGDEEPFVFSQHLRIIVAILFCLISASVLWWIMT